MTKKLSIIIFSLLLFIASPALAVCPVCTIAVGAGVGVSRSAGIDDLIVGLWIGGFLTSLIMWTEDWLSKKNINFKGRTIVNILVYLSLTIIPLYTSGIIGNPVNTFCGCGIDELVFGIIGGAVAFWCGARWYEFLKKRNNNKAYFPFQKVVMPILPLIILSLIFYILII